ncbi:VRR-NUC domain protein [Sporomusa ovata DSM 2662]|uniref:VRR-NUC domain-containing protein n=1 Tax=Sporomusa ovata TaxID=2378 RepID=UPI00038845A2|nr:VRR-NUC domain-containing protein [Sporomusa ovata]EQB28125.1 VRR-NUC domain-containing protein [Sporomusa ovata DSM 2662]
MRESFLERQLVNAVKQIGGLALKWVSPGNNGVFDRIVILPRGQVVFVEMKAPGKPLRPLQEKWARTFRQMGHRVYKIDSVADIATFIVEVMPNAV